MRTIDHTFRRSPEKWVASDQSTRTAEEAAQARGYAAAKAGAINLTRWIAKQVGPWGITANCVAPGPIESPMTVNADYGVEHIPVPRMGRPDEMAAAVAYLAGPDSGYTNGICLHVDGGAVLACTVWMQTSVSCWLARSRSKLYMRYARGRESARETESWLTTRCRTVDKTAPSLLRQLCSLVRE